MSDVKHTPGPWGWAYRQHEGANDGSVFWMKRPGHSYCVAKAPRYQSREQWEADARLLSAAPELLEALESMWKFVDGLVPEGSYAPGCNSALEKARYAISKARGEAQG